MDRISEDIPSAVANGESVEVLLKQFQLESAVFNVLNRRGRRKLRDIQAASLATLKLDQLRKVLEVKGTKDSIEYVVKQLSHLSGHRIPVSATIWAELMRTRTLHDPSQAGVACIQDATGARIHIDRDVLQIQLFGPAHVTNAAQVLLKELESMILIQAVDIENPGAINPQTLSYFAHDYCVSLQVKEKQIVVIGIKDAASEAARELHQHIASESPCEKQQEEVSESTQDDVPESAQVATRAVKEAMSQLRTMSENIVGISVPTVTEIEASGYNQAKTEESLSSVHMEENSPRLCINSGTDQQFFINTCDSLPPFVDELGSSLEHHQCYVKTADSLPPYEIYKDDNLLGI